MDGILLRIHLPCGRLSPGNPLAEYLLLSEWDAFRALLQQQEEMVTAWRSYGRFNTAEPTVAELTADTAEQREKTRHCLQKELPACRQKQTELTAAIAAEQRRMAELERTLRARQASAGWRQEDALDAASCEQLLDLVLGANDPGPAAGMQVSSDLLQTLRARLGAILTPTLPLPLDDFCRLGAHGQSVLTFEDRFGRFTAECHAIRKAPGLDDSGRQTAWRKLQRVLR